MKLKSILKEVKINEYEDEFVELTLKDVENEIKSVLGDMVEDVHDKSYKGLITIEFRSNDDMRNFIRNNDKFSTKIENKLKRKFKLKPSDDLVMAGIVRGKGSLSFTIAYIKP